VVPGDGTGDGDGDDVVEDQGDEVDLGTKVIELVYVDLNSLTDAELLDLQNAEETDD
jgi:hypothetical protein